MNSFGKNIKWIFLDVGSTLVDESEAYDHRVREMTRGTEISFENFDKKRIALATQGLDGNSAAIEFFGLKKTPWHSEDELLYPDAISTLSTLCERGYRLGIIANQNLGLNERLADFGISKFFDIVVSSAEVGCSKPDRKIFEWALSLASCKAEECVMVGDRLDNDMAPAKAVGMKTVWIRNGLARHQAYELGKDIADRQIGSLSELLSLF